MSPPTRTSILQLAVHDEEKIGARRLLQMLRRWKIHSSTKQVPALAHQPIARPTSCYAPLSCVTFPSNNLHPDLDEDDDDDLIDITPESRSKIALQIPSPRLDYPSSESAHAAEIWSHKPAMEGTPCTGKRKGTRRILQVRAGCRALSCPKLRSRACIPSPSMYVDEQQQEELECLQPKQEEEDRMKLQRSSSSSSLKRYNVLRKQASIPKGYIALYVGEERRRFVVKASWLNHPLFSILLEKAKEEFGFDQKGPLNIPCDVAFFQDIMSLVQSS